MKKFIKVFSIILVVAMTLALVVGLTACDKSDPDTLHVYTNAEFPPFEYMEKGEYKGFDMDLIKAIGKEMGLKVEIHHVDFDAIIPSIQSSSYANTVAIAGMDITPDRLESVDFSDPYLTSAYQVVVTTKGDTSFDACKTKEDVINVLKAKSNIFVAKGQIGHALATGSMGFPNIGIPASAVKVSDTIGLAISTMTKVTDCALADNITAAATISEDVNKDKYKIIDINLADDYYGIAVKKGDKAMADKVNAALKKIKKDGTFDEIYEEYKSSIEQAE